MKRDKPAGTRAAPSLAALAQAAATGTITGRVYNPVTGEYIRNAFNSGKTWFFKNSDGRIRQMKKTAASGRSGSAATTDELPNLG